VKYGNIRRLGAGYGWVVEGGNPKNSRG